MNRKLIWIFLMFFLLTGVNFGCGGGGSSSDSGSTGSGTDSLVGTWNIIGSPPTSDFPLQFILNADGTGKAIRPDSSFTWTMQTKYQGTIVGSNGSTATFSLSGSIIYVLNSVNISVSYIHAQSTL